MCGRYILTQKITAIEKRFNVRAEPDVKFEANYNIAPGCYAPVITSNDSGKLQLLRFGMCPFWAKKNMMLINARAEGDRNKDNSEKYNGAKEIINKPAFRKPIRQQRCLVIADAYIEGSTNEGLNKAHLVFLRNKVRPFAFAGLWDEWQNPDTKEILHSFSIVTTAANSLIQKIPHLRVPLILQAFQEKKWLDLKTPLSYITGMLHPFSVELMNAFPISAEIKDVKNNALAYIQPIGNSLAEEIDFVIEKKISLQGMGNRKRREGETLEKRLEL